MNPIAKALFAALSLATVPLSVMAAEPIPTLTISQSDWHVSLNGFHWSLPDACLNPRQFGAGDAGRNLGEGDAGRNLGAADSGRNLGAADSGRNLGAADSGRNLGAADSGRNLGAADSGRNLGAADSGRNLGAADSGRNLGEGDAGRNMGAADMGRNLGAGDAGRNLGESAAAPHCEYISNNQIASGVYIWPASAGTLQLNTAVPEFKSVISWREGALIELH